MANESFTACFEDSFTVDSFIDTDSEATKLKDIIENLNLNYDAEKSRRILADCLSACSLSSLDEKILKELLPVAQRTLLEILDTIGGSLAGNVERETLNWVKQRLSVCHEFLGIWEQCLEHLARLRNVSATDVRSLPETLPTTVQIVFDHCKSSRKTYDRWFDGLSKELTDLFRKANAILKQFLATLNGVIVFDTEVESETELLVDVINLIGRIATTANGMDLKTYVEACKGFGKLAITHQNEVKRIDNDNVTLRIEQIAKDVANILATFKDEDDSMQERTIRASGLLLKILDKLLMAFCSSMKNEALISVIELLLQMHRCSLPCSGQSEIHVDLINNQISLGCEPFLNTVFKNPDSKQAYFEYGSRANVDPLGYHLLTLSIMKKLIGMPYANTWKWTLGAESILDTAFANINNVQEEILAGDVSVPGAHEIGERPRRASLYEATFLGICSLISQVPADSFHVVELLLSKYLLGGQLFSSLLSADVWCFLARLGSSELCAAQIKYLSRVYGALSERKDSLELIVLENLIGRLYTLLSDGRKESLAMELIDPNDPNFCLPIAKFLPAKAKSFHRNRLSKATGEISKAFQDLHRQPTVQNWARFGMLLSLLGETGSAENRAISDLLRDTWSFVASTIEEFEGRHLNFLSEFIVVLLNASRPDNLQDDVFPTILESILSSSLCLPPASRMQLANYLRRNVHTLANRGPEVSCLIAELDCRLLEDENPWVRQASFEAFDHLAHTSPDEDLVTRIATAVTKRQSIRDSVPAYLSQVPFYRLQDFSGERDYLGQLARTSSHVCPVHEESRRCEKYPRTDSFDGRTNQEADKRLNRICDELDLLTGQRELIGEQTVGRLKALVEKFLE